MECGKLCYADAPLSRLLVCIQSKDEFNNVLKAHKAYVKERFPHYSGEGQDAYADAGDLGADPELLKGNSAAQMEQPVQTKTTQKATANGISQNGHAQPAKLAIAA